MAPCSLPRKKSSSRQSRNVKLRYVERRGDRSGGERWYWHRRGHKLTRLPDDLAARITMAEQLNAAADRVPLAEFARGSIAWVIQRYRDSDQYDALSPGTILYYKRFLRDIEVLGPALPFTSFTRRAVVDFIETYAKPHQRRQAAAVLSSGSPAITGLSPLTRPRGCVSKPPRHLTGSGLTRRSHAGSTPQPGRTRTCRQPFCCCNTAHSARATC